MPVDLPPNGYTLLHPPMKRPLLPLCLAGLLILLQATVHAQKVEAKPVSTLSPGYPGALADTGLSGQAEVYVTIKTDGSVADARR